MNKVTIIVVVVLAWAAACVPCYAANRPQVTSQVEKLVDRRLQKMTERLTLSSGQRGRIREILLRWQLDIADLSADAEHARGKVSSAGLKELSRVNTAKIDAILTEEQRQRRQAKKPKQ